MVYYLVRETKKGEAVVRSRVWRCLRRVLAGLLAAAILLGALLFDSNWHIQRTVLQTPVTALPEAFAGFRVAVLADLHGRQFDRESQRLLRQVAETEPDIIAICGDLFDAETDRTILEPLARGLVKIAPVYYVTGNHEWTCPDLPALLERLEDWGVTVLANEYRVLERAGQRLVLAGVHDPNGPYDMKTPAQLLEEIRAQEGADACTVLLTHRNDQLNQWAQLGVPLALCGHGHGGMVRLPGVGGLFSPGGHVPAQFDAGLYTLGATRMAVSRGLGSSPGTLRLFNRPELLVVVLTAENMNNP